MKCNLFFWQIAVQLGTLPILTFSAMAQVIPDGTLPTEVEQVNNEYRILGGAKAGNNLFHSFREFSVPPTFQAIFNNSNDLANIFGRVTGNSISIIEGIIKANGTANLFLINPNGIIFGPDAQLNIGGSFFASTASSIKFADGTQFSSNNLSTPPVLTVSVPIGLQFGNNPGSIVNRSVSKNANNVPVGLNVNPGNTLGLVGGNIQLEGGRLTAIGGRIELGSVSSQSFVNLIPINQGWQLGYEGVRDFSDIQLSNQSLVNASGAGGTAQLQGRNIELTTGALIQLNVIGNESSGNLIINASESLVLQSTPSQITGLSAFMAQDLEGNGANITLNAKNLTIRDGAVISLVTDGQGTGGQLTINAATVEILGVGDAIPSLITTTTGGKADAGAITINTERLIVANGGQILAVTTNVGNGGIITINASESVELTGSIPLPSRNIITPSLISTASGFEDLNQPGIGTAGNINLNTGQLIISDGGRISTGSFQGGEAGNLTINANSILLNGGRILAESTSSSGGNIFINASDVLTLRNNSLISATAGTAQAGGNGGNIFINAPFIFAVPIENSDIRADAFTGTGGNVTINENSIFGIALRDALTPLSDITVSSQFGQAGNVLFNRPEVDPQTGLVTFPSQIGNDETVIVQTCGVGGAFARGEFIITGRGGMVENPYDAPEISTTLADLGENVASGSSATSKPHYSESVPVSSPPQRIIEAQGWIRDSSGNLILTAQVENVTPSTSGLNSTHCDLSGGNLTPSR
ncbi:filamentous hemagglutinin family outer membrane protein [Gloeothece citriformis PCC 7424]|uniref:Filamentous hemagglutinin family outer membrane protein n=1 Tax=Gloeothece citriformis (strain PCC 7424) TaxID=65393 RepID=B7KC89_GLOC7|nr:filamentous hemagglutinin N-terminal domain-containing protein [Gloeothece citriformis]ACK70194.1 filamentous hemagglutinin family outer membrane protein [Gloeothece citriformis PCC 7424]